MLPNGTVTLAAINARLVMTRMAEENEVFDRIDLMCREWPRIIAKGRQTPDLFAVPLHGAMAGHAFRNGRKPRALSGFDRCVTVHAFNLQRRMLLMTEMHRLILLRGEAGYGNEKATSESE